MDALYTNTIGIRAWQQWREGGIAQDTSQSRGNDYATNDSDSAESIAWQSDYIHCPGYLVDSYSDQAYSQIFGPADFLNIESDESGSPTEQGTFPTAFKIQQLLIRKLTQGKIHARLYECIQKLRVFRDGLCKSVLAFTSGPEIFMADDRF